MVLPKAGDLEIAARQSFPFEAAAGEQRDRRRVVGQAGRLDPMQLQMLEGKAHGEADGRCHQAAPRIGGADPVAQRCRLGDAAAHIREGEGAQQLPLARGKDEEWVGRIVLDLAPVALDAAAEGGPGQVVGRPDGLPRRQEFAAAQAEIGPGLIVGGLGRAHFDGCVAQNRRRIGSEGRPEENHGSLPFRRNGRRSRRSSTESTTGRPR